MEDHVGYTLTLLVEDIKKENLKKENENMDLKAESPRLQCHVCYKTMGHRSSLYKHLKYIHKIEPAHRLTICCREKDCYQSFTFLDPFRRHLAEQHGFDIVVEKYIFQSMTEFFSWKKITEQKENLRFIVSTGPRSSKGGKTHYYRCQKNGIYKPELKRRLQSENDSIYNMSRTHCISSMFVFEESECVTVEFCRTHYGHEVATGEKNKADTEVTEEADSNIGTEKSYETVDTYSKLNAYLSEKDKAALVNLLNENQTLLEETEELFYENEQDVMLKIPYNVLTKILDEGVKEELVENDTDTNAISTSAEGEFSYDEMTVEKLEEDDSNDPTILKSLGNGMFLEPTSNKKIRLDSFIKKTKKDNTSSASPSQHEPRKKDREKGTMFVKEYLNEFDEKVYVLEPVTDTENVVRKREKILSQLQSILMLVNSEEDIDALDDIEQHLSRYATPE